MASPGDELKRFLNDLLRQGDELRLKLHLATADARDEWVKIERKWEELKGKRDVLCEAAEDVSEDIVRAAKQLAAEVEKGYERIRSLL